METIGAIQSIKKIDKEIHIHLYRIVNITNFIKLCFIAGNEDKVIASVIEANAIKEKILFSEAVWKIRINKHLILPLSSEEEISSIEFYEENNRKEKHKIFQME